MGDERPVETGVDPPLSDAALAVELKETMAPRPGYSLGASLERVCRDRGWNHQRVRYRLRRAGLYRDVLAAKYPKPKEETPCP